MPVTTFEFDAEQIAALKEAVGAAALGEALDIAATYVHLIAEGAAKEATPVITGHARRSTISDVRGADKVVEAAYPYFRWLDTGTDSRGRQMKTRPGGYQIAAAAMKAAVEAAPAALDKAGREIADRWGS